jgi:hypothetical protein
MSIWARYQRTKGVYSSQDLFKKPGTMTDNIAAYVTEKDEAFVICPECGRLQRISVGSFRGKKHTLKVRCSCNHEFSVSLDFRKGIRKRVSLDGLLRKASQKSKPFKKCVVEDLSFKGVRVKGYETEDLQVGDELIIRFFLDDPDKTEVRRKIKVYNIARKNSFGALFVDQESDPYDPSIAFFLIQNLKS